MLNAIQKLHALMVSKEVNIWQFANKKEGPQYYYWLTNEPDNTEGYGFNTLEEMVEAAYSNIDPLKKDLPKEVTEPHQIKLLGE